MPPHRYFNTTYIIIDPNNINTNYESKLYFNDINVKEYKDKYKEALLLLKSIFNYSLVAPPLGEHEIVMHVRSGDIFNTPPSHGSYLQPPLSYYENCMKGYDIVHIVAEDTKNPVTNELIRKYSNIKFNIQSLNDDIGLILRAKYCVTSFGTFIPALMCISTNIKKLYTFSYIAKRAIFLENYILDITNLEEYRKSMGTWINSSEQREKMLTI